MSVSRETAHFFKNAVKGEAIREGDKSSYTDKQQRQTEHIDTSPEEKSLQSKRPKSTLGEPLNKESDTGKKSESKKFLINYLL